MNQHELNGLVGARLQEARSARNLSLSALTTAEDPDAAPEAADAGPRPGGLGALPGLVRSLAGSVTGLLVERLTGAATGGDADVRRLDRSVVDEATVDVLALTLSPGRDYLGEHTAAGTEHLVVTSGRVRVSGPSGDVLLSVGDSHTWPAGAAHRCAADDGAATAVLVRRLAHPSR